MKIGLMIPTLLHGGAERAICRLSHILASAGYEVYLIVFDASKKFYSYSGTLIDLKIPSGTTYLGKIITFLKRIIAVKKIKKEMKMDSIISFIAAATFVNCLTKSNSKCIVSQRNFMSKESGSILKKRFLKYCFNRADTVIAVAELCRLDIIESFGIEDNKVYTIYNAYDQDEIYAQKDKPLIRDHDKFFDDHDINIITVGRLEYQKGFWNLLKVISLIREKNINCGLTIVGEGSQINKLKRLCLELKIHNHVQFVGYQSNPYSYVGKADIYVMSSLFEGFPNALVEAMCCGKPIISTDCPSGPREIIQGADKLKEKCSDIEYCKYGILVPCFSDVENWDSKYFNLEQKRMAEAIIQLIDDESLRRNLAKAAKERSKEFSYEACLEKYEKLI